MSIEKFSVPSHLENYITPDEIKGKGVAHGIKASGKVVTSKMSRIIKYFSEGMSRLYKSDTGKKWHNNVVTTGKIGESSKIFENLISGTINRQKALRLGASKNELIEFKKELDIAEKKASEFSGVIDKIAGLINPDQQLNKSKTELQTIMTLIKGEQKQIDSLLDNYLAPCNFSKLRKTPRPNEIRSEVPKALSHVENLAYHLSQIKTSGQANECLRECDRTIRQLQTLDQLCFEFVKKPKADPAIRTELEKFHPKIQEGLKQCKETRSKLFITGRMLQGIESVEEVQSLIEGDKEVNEILDLRSQLHYIAAVTKNAVSQKTLNSDHPIISRFKEKLAEAEAKLESSYKINADEIQSQEDFFGQIAVIQINMTHLTANSRSLTPVYIKTGAKDIKEFLHLIIELDNEAPGYPKESPQAQSQEGNRNAIKELIQKADQLIDGADKALKNEEKTLQELSPKITAVGEEIKKAWETPLYADKATELEALRLKSKVMVDTLKKLDVKSDSPHFEKFQNLQTQADTLLDDIRSKLKASRKIAVVESTHLQIEKFLGETRKLEISIKQPDNNKPVESFEKNIAEIKRLQKAVTRFGNEPGVSSKELNKLTKKVADLAGPLKEQFFQSLTKEIELNKKAMLNTKHSETLTKEIRHANYIDLFEKFQSLEAKINTPTPVNQEADFRDLNQLSPEERTELNSDLKECKTYLRQAFLENMETLLKDFESQAKALIEEYSKETNQEIRNHILKKATKIQELSKHIGPEWSARWNSTMEMLEELQQTGIEKAPPLRTKEYAGHLIKESHPLLEAVKDDIFLLNDNPSDENIEKMFEHLKTLENLQNRIEEQHVSKSSPNYAGFNDLKEEVSELQTWIQVNRLRATAELRKIKNEQDKVEDFVATFLQPYLQGKINPATEGDRKPLEMQLQEALGIAETPLNKEQSDAAIDTFIREGMKGLNRLIMAGIGGKIPSNYSMNLYPEMIEVFLGRLETNLPKEFPSLNLSGEQIRERFTKILATFK